VKRLPFAVLIVAIGSVALAEEKDDRSPAQKTLERRFDKKEIAEMRKDYEKRFWEHLDGKSKRSDFETNVVRDLLQFRDGYKIFLKGLDKLPADAISWDHNIDNRTPEARAASDKKHGDYSYTRVLLMAMIVPPFDKEVPDKLLPRYAAYLEWASQHGPDMALTCDFLAKRGKRAKDVLPKLRDIVKIFHKRKDEVVCDRIEKAIEAIEKDAKR
jgi:hypothetical protein